MKRFRHPQEPKKMIRHEEMQLMDILDKCTQILREDRIYIRNRIKDNDEEILSYFRQPKQINMQQLQINLRKYLNQVKANNKIQQLIKFKENNEGHFSCEAKESVGKRCQNIPASMLLSNSKANQNIQEVLRDHSSTQNIQNGFLKPIQNSLRNQRCSSLTQLSKLKPTNTKPSHRNSEKKLPTYYQINKQVFIESDSFQPLVEQSNSKRQSQANKNSIKKHARTNSATSGGGKAENKKQNQQSSGQKKRYHTQIKNQREYAKDIEQFQYQLNSDWEGKSGTYGPTTIFHNAESNDYSSNNQFYSSQGYDASNFYTSTQGDNNKYRGTTYQKLFTPPEMLMQCRKYIEKSKQFLPTLSFHNLPSNAPSFSKPTDQNISQVKRTGPIQLEKAFQILQQQDLPIITVLSVPDLCPMTFPSYQSKQDEQISHINEQSITSPGDGTIEAIQINLDSKYQTNKVEFKPQQIQPPQLPNLSEYYAQDIIDILYYNKDGAWLQSSDYAFIVYSNFADIKPFEKIFAMADVDGDGKVNVTELGELFAKAAKTKSNPVKQFFDLIDLDKTGIVTQDEYQRFLDQISASEQAEFEQVRRSADKVFGFADFNRRAAISYWGVYLTKGTWQFQEFSAYLQQFEFSIEP